MPLPKEPKGASGGRLGGTPTKPTDISKRQVKRVKKNISKARRVREVPGSGNKPDDKGDIDLGQVLLELKTTTSAKSISIKLEVLQKITEEALAVGKEPGLVISFETPGVPVYVSRDWVLLPAKAVGYE